MVCATPEIDWGFEVWVEGCCAVLCCALLCTARTFVLTSESMAATVPTELLLLVTSVVKRRAAACGEEHQVGSCG